jgi:hypothetical protein
LDWGSAPHKHVNLVCNWFVHEFLSGRLSFRLFQTAECQKYLLNFPGGIWKFAATERNDPIPYEIHFIVSANFFGISQEMRHQFELITGFSCNDQNVGDQFLHESENTNVAVKGRLTKSPSNCNHNP